MVHLFSFHFDYSFIIFSLIASIWLNIIIGSAILRYPHATPCAKRKPKSVVAFCIGMKWKRPFSRPILTNGAVLPVSELWLNSRKLIATFFIIGSKYYVNCLFRVIINHVCLILLFNLLLLKEFSQWPIN